MSEKDYSKFLVRLTPKVRALLDVAHIDLEVPRAQIINNALKDYLKRYDNAGINARLDRLVK